MRESERACPVRPCVVLCVVSLLLIKLFVGALIRLLDPNKDFRMNKEKPCLNLFVAVNSSPAAEVCNISALG